jgi:hypothetical protein
LGEDQSSSQRHRAEVTIRLLVPLRKSFVVVVGFIRIFRRFSFDLLAAGDLDDEVMWCGGYDDDSIISYGTLC